MVTESSSEPSSRDSQRSGPRAVQTPKPILASEVLREELAPIEPGNAALRYWLLAMALLMAGLGVGILQHWVALPSSGAPVAFAVAAAIAASLAMPYRLRGGVVIAAAVSALLLGLLNRGCLAGIVGPMGNVPELIARALVMAGLPAALLFRSHYRAYGGARVVLATAIVLSIPAAFFQGRVIAAVPALLPLVMALLCLAAWLAAFIGFMGAGTTAGSTAVAVSILLAFGLDLAARGVTIGESVTTNPKALYLSLIFTIVCCVTAIGLFKILASSLARFARRVDVLGAEEDVEDASQEGPD